MVDNIRVLLVDDHPIVRDGVCTLLEEEPDIEVIGKVGSGEEALQFLRETKADVIIMDLGLPGISGIEATRLARRDHPDVRVLALTMYTDNQYLIGMLEAGAVGYLLKQSMVNELVQAIRSVSDGQCFLGPSTTKTAIETLRRPQVRARFSDSLTSREKDVLRLVGLGYTSKRIASKLCLSPKTVENHRARILAKLQARNCSEAVSTAIGLSHIEPLPQSS